MEKVLELLRKNRVMCIATCSKDKPRSSILEYVMVGDSMIFMTDPRTIKAANIEKNPKVSLTVMESEPGAKLEELLYVAIDGTAVKASAKKVSAYNTVLFQRYPEFKAFIESGAMNNVYYEVKFRTAWYSVGMAPAEMIKMKK
ncbi:MAG: pyridoxamine 5'-phosphate oxidase family protein [Methanomassiliicoccaceae archaeon]|jgi:uncharacterized pyridoxamine 5'-phosphate oxidase family protein|nr:pyridoxamine 5'-phosphate oxidase family protein [Methanomassiliicoccaceae archaeon]